MAKRKDETSSSRFQVGDSVRVKRGVMDVDYPDLPLGGWAGTIVEVQEDGNFTVQWTQETLAAMPPIYKKRCEKDGLEIERYWLGPNDLISDPGGPVEIEQPTNIVTKPLDLNDEDDRIRSALGLTSDDPLSDVDFASLKVYRDYLAEHLSFPFEAVLDKETGPFFSSKQKVSVIGLGDSDEEFRIDEDYGLICEIKFDSQRGDAPLAELETKKEDRNRRLVEDYRSWFWNNR